MVSIQTKVVLPGSDQPPEWKHGCSGVLLKPNLVLTTCSCVTQEDSDRILVTVASDSLRVHTTDNDLYHAAATNIDEQIVGVKNVSIHPGCDNQFTLDFGILITDKKIRVGRSVRLVEIFSNDSTKIAQTLQNQPTHCFTFTYHLYKDGSPIKLLTPEQGIRVSIHPISYCSEESEGRGEKLEGEKTTKWCAVSVNTPICRMDTGSPVLKERKLVAIVSNAEMDCEKRSRRAIISGVNSALDFITDFSAIARARASLPSIAKSLVIVFATIAQNQSLRSDSYWF